MSTDPGVRVGPQSVDGDDAAPAVFREKPSGRRRHRGVLAIVAAAVVVATAVPLTWQRDALPEEAPTPVLRPADIYGVPTRGSLAGDAGFVEVVRRAPWNDHRSRTMGLAAPPLDTRRVVFAGEVDGTRLAFVVGGNTAADSSGDLASAGTLAGAWFVGGAAGVELHTVPHGIADDSPTALVAPGGHLLVVAAPGDTVEVSERPEIDADGVRSRTYDQVETSADGVAVHRLSGSGSDRVTSVPLWNAVSVRVLRDGALVGRLAPDRSATEATPAIGVRMHQARGIANAPAVVAQHVAVNALVQLGRTDLDTDVAAQWAGPVPHWEGTTAAVVTVTVPSGAVVVAAEVQKNHPEGGFTSTTCGLEARPAGLPAEVRIHATACPSPDGTDPLGALVVVAPPHVASVRVYDADGGFVDEHPAHEGVVAVPLSHGVAKVEGVTTGGVSLGRSDLLAHADLLGD